MRIGIIREGKTPPDQRVPLTPAQCAEVLERFPYIELVVQPSEVRRIADAEYTEAGVELSDHLEDCDVLFGVKEVPVDQLIPDKTYFFFSHTFKLQPYNAKLLRACLDKRIRLIDYELLKRPGGRRIIGFGRYAGIVGTYNAFRTYGAQRGTYDLPRAIDCADRKEMEGHLSKVKLDPTTKIALTGHGRVGNGAREILEAMKVREVHPVDYLREDFGEPVFTHLDLEDYNRRAGDGGFDFDEFCEDPIGYESTFMAFARSTDLFIAGHYWAEGSPFLFAREDVRDDDWRISVVADISCDIDGPVATTLEPSTIADPMYGYDPIAEKRVPFGTPGSVGVMAVDNLPCELPRDASADFGATLVEHIIPLVVEGDSQGILKGASETTLEGTLTPAFEYLSEYAGLTGR
ncbi:MAG: alanine dehydrogenase [Crocinitomicaceae bacterium TMED114]|nr:MAG: alanine dehydrogenase [Crocinitomicaceae bacterium TMED114]